MIKTDILSGWGHYPKQTVDIYRPERYKDLDIPSDTNLICRGAGRSYGDAALSHDGQVWLMTRMNRILSFDPNKGILRAEAGLTLHELLKTFVPFGWFIDVCPGTSFVTLGGCVASDIHGKNHHDIGSFVNCIKQFNLLSPRGLIECSRKDNADVFWSTVGGMGLTGIITDVSVQLRPIETAYITCHEHKTKNLEQTFALLEAHCPTTPYSVAWLDCMPNNKSFGRGIVFQGEHTLLKQLPKKFKAPLHLKAIRQHKVPGLFPSQLLNPMTMGWFNKIYSFRHARNSKPFYLDYRQFFFPLDQLTNWPMLYGKAGFLQYQCVIPIHHAFDGIQAILDYLKQQKIPVFLAVLKRFGEQNLSPLSFAREGYTLALDIPLTVPDLFTQLDQLDQLVLKAHGRLYLAKDSRLNQANFQAMYPRWQQWKKVKNKLDPTNQFQSSLSHRLGLT